MNEDLNPVSIIHNDGVGLNIGGGSSDIDFDSDKPLACPMNPEPGETCEACQ